VEGARRGALACSAAGIRQLEQHLRPLSPLGPGRRLGAGAAGAARRPGARASDDRPHARACPSAQRRGQGGSAAQAIGRSRGGLGTKLHLLVDALGQLVRVVRSAGQAHDATPAQAVLEGERAERVSADKAQDADRIRQAITDLGATDRGAQAVIPPHPCRAQAIAHDQHLDQHLDKERHVIECLISRLKPFRRIATRPDKTQTSFLGCTALAATVIGLR
jgi:transposase